MSGYEVRSTHNASGWGVAISTRGYVYKPSVDTDFTQSVDELVVSHRRG
jgi:hypothetical protein